MAYVGVGGDAGMQLSTNSKIPLYTEFPREAQNRTFARPRMDDGHESGLDSIQ